MSFSLNHLKLIWLNYCDDSRTCVSLLIKAFANLFSSDVAIVLKYTFGTYPSTKSRKTSSQNDQHFDCFFTKFCSLYRRGINAKWPTNGRNINLVSDIPYHHTTKFSFFSVNQYSMGVYWVLSVFVFRIFSVSAVRLRRKSKINCKFYRASLLWLVFLVCVFKVYRTNPVYLDKCNLINQL